MDLNLKEPFSTQPNEVRLEALEEVFTLAEKMEKALTKIYEMCEKSEGVLSVKIIKYLDKTFK